MVVVNAVSYIEEFAVNAELEMAQPQVHHKCLFSLTLF